ncbi:MAG: hypothetical protein ACK502_10210 [Alphaproteobacteria bacterium]
MTFTKHINDRDLQALYEQMVLVLTSPDITPKWTEFSGKKQIIHKIGHTFTTAPHFPDDIHDRLTQKLRETLSAVGYDTGLVQQAFASIDREDGEITVDIPLAMFDTLQEALAPISTAITPKAKLREPYGRH